MKVVPKQSYNEQTEHLNQKVMTGPSAYTAAEIRLEALIDLG